MPQGAVHVFEQNITTKLWQVKQRLQAVTPRSFERFGTAVAMTEELLVVGVPGRDASLSVTESVC
jgi:hypothetical protein